MGCAVLQFARASVGIRVWFVVQAANGSLRTGLVAGNFTVTIIRDDDAASNTPVVSESATVAGVYFFDVPTAFLTTNGNQYAMLIQVTLAPIDSMLAPLFVTADLWDQLATQADILSDATPFPGAFIDTTISSRSDFDEATDPVELLPAGGAAGINAEELIDLNWDEVNRGADHNVKDSTGKQQRQASGGFGSEDVVSAGASTIELAATESAINGFLNRRHIAIVDGLGVGQIRVIDSYVGATKIATVSRAWDVVPDATSDYLLLLSSESTLTPLERTTVSAVISAELLAAHGAGSWVGVAAVGFATPADVAASTLAITTLGGAGPWTTGTGLSDWTTGEREQIRFRLSLDGTQTDPTTDAGDHETLLTRFGIGNDETEYEDATSTTPGSIKSPPVTGTRLDRTVTQTAPNKVKVGP